MLMEILVVVLLMFGAVLHGVTGMGFPMISTISIALIFPLPVTIALVILPNVVINAMVLIPTKNGKPEDGIIFAIKKYWQLIISSVIGSFFGVMLLKFLPAGWLYLLLSTSTLFYIFYTFINKKKEIKKETTNKKVPYNTLKMLIFGGLAGVIGGATNAMSSILMIYLLAVSDNKSEIVKTSNMCFLLAKIVQVLLLRDQLIGLGTRELWAIPIFTILGMIMLFIGIKIRDKISIEMFKKIVLLMLFILSLKAGWNAITLLI